MFALAAVVALAMGVSSALADVAADNEAVWASLPGDETTEHSVMMDYTAIIEPYYGVMDDAADPEMAEEMRADPEYSSLMFAVDSGSFGYALKDLDGDGNPELIIATMGASDPLYEDMVLLLATSDGQDGRVLFVSTPEEGYYYAGSAYFACQRDGEAGDTTLELENGALKDLGEVTAVEMYEQLELEPIAVPEA